MHRFFREYLRKMKINTILLISIMVLLVIFAAMVFRDTNKYDTEDEYSLKAVPWERKDLDNHRDVYYLRKGNNYLVITCANQHLTVTDLRNLSIVRAVIGGKDHRLYSVGLNGKLWYVPTINEDPNPTQEQIDFLKALTRADYISFEVDRVKHTWATSNSTTLSHCVDLNQKPTPRSEI